MTVFHLKIIISQECNHQIILKQINYSLFLIQKNLQLLLHQNKINDIYNMVRVYFSRNGSDYLNKKETI